MERLVAVSVIAFTAALWNSLVAWLFIGIVWAVGAVIGETDFDPALLWLWPMILAYGYLVLWQETRPACRP